MKGWIKLDDKRLDTPDYAPRAVFEAIVNALIHRDYTELGSETHIDIFDDRLVVYSPGGMMDGTFIQEQSIDHVASKRRNPVLADVFAQLRLMEKRGSGLRKICDETAKIPNYKGSMRPEFSSQAAAFFTTFFNCNARKDIGVVKEPFKYPVNGPVRQFGPVNDPVNGPVKLDKLQREIVEMMRHNSSVTRPEICQKLAVSLTTVRRTIAKLKAAGIIERTGADKNGRWTVKI